MIDWIVVVDDKVIEATKLMILNPVLDTMVPRNGRAMAL